MSESKNEQTYNSDLSKIAKNASISGMGEIIFNALGYITSVVITRTVGPSIFGVFSLANTVLNIASIFSAAGLGHGLLRFVAFYKGKGDFCRMKGAIIFGTKVSFFLSLFFALAIFHFADLIANNFFHNRSVGMAIKILLISLPFFTVGSIWLKCIQSFQMIKYQVYIQKILQPAIRLVSVALFFFIGLKLTGILIASIVSLFLGFVVAFYYLQKLVPIHKKTPVPIYEKKELINFSLPITFTQFLRVISIYIDTLMLAYFKTTYEVGVYSAVVKIALLISLPLISFTDIFAPMISEFYSRKEIKKLEDLYRIITKWIITLSFPTFLVFALFSESIMGIFGDKFVAGAGALIIFSGFQLIDAGVGPAGIVILMIGRPKFNLYATIIFCGLNIILNYFLIPEYGIIGAAISTGISIAVINILKIMAVYVFLKIQPFKLNFLKPCVAGLLSFVVIFLITHDRNVIPLYNVAVLLLFFLGLYVLFIYILRLDDEDKYILKLIYEKMITFKNASI